MAFTVIDVFNNYKCVTTSINQDAGSEVIIQKGWKIFAHWDSNKRLTYFVSCNDINYMTMRCSDKCPYKL